MCGIFGYVLSNPRTPPHAVRKDLIIALATLNTRRGHHSWGAYTHSGQAPRVAGTVWRDLGPMSAACVLGELALGSTVMAHCRHATTGAVTTKNAHPLMVGSVLGAHNGMVYNHEELTVRYQRRVEVDSAHLFHHIDEERDFEDVVGYGTVEYVRLNGDLREIHLCRMAHGQLAAYGLGSRGAPYGVVWSSDEAHLRTALAYVKLQGFPHCLRESRVYTAGVDGMLHMTAIEHRLSTHGLSHAEQRRMESITQGAAVSPMHVCRSTSKISGTTRMPDGTYTTRGGRIVPVEDGG